MQETLRKLIAEALGGSQADFVVEHPADLAMGDYSTNAGIKYRDKKDQIFEYLDKNKPKEVERVEMAGPGFINFYLSKKFFAGSIGGIIKEGEKFGKSKKLKGEKVMVEYTDPNPFKEFHIGHLMSNAIGEAVSRIIEWNGAEVKRANYQGDVGMHVAMALWKGDYPLGAKAYKEDPKARTEIEEINRKIYEKSDPELNRRYEEGKQDSLKKFEEMYARLGTKFDYYFFESETAPVGEKIVKDNLGKVFEESEGAVVFKGGHTRVFINSQGLPTYEAKDLGNAVNKYEKYKYTQSIVVTGNEIKDYFRVVLEALGRIYPELADKTKHLPHGMLRLPTGKMSSRTGDVITAESLIEEVRGRLKPARTTEGVQSGGGDEQVAIGAIKYMILRSNIGGDIVFDIDKSVSTEGDSGVYLQYAHARANSLLEKAGKKGSAKGEQGEVREVERLLYRFPEIIERAQEEYAPHYITTYLTELASSFNNFYAHEQVIGDSEEADYRLAIVEAFRNVMKNGLSVLGIPAPLKM